MSRAYAVPSNNITAGNDGGGNAFSHFCGAQPSATVGLRLLAYLGYVTSTGSGTTRLEVIKFDSTGPPTAITPEKLNTHAPAAAATAVTGAGGGDEGTTKVGNPYLAIGAPINNAAETLVRGWTPPRARDGMPGLPANKGDHVGIIANDPTALATGTFTLLFEEDDKRGYQAYRSGRRSPNRAGSIQYNNELCTLWGSSATTRPKGKRSYSPEINYVTPLDWPEPVRDPAAQLNLLLAAGGTVFEINVSGTLDAAAIAGALSKIGIKPLAGALSAPNLQGALQRMATKVLAGAGTPTGALTRLTIKPLSGTIGTITGTVTTSLLRVVTLAGDVGTIVGDLVRVPSKAVAGSSSSAGALLKEMAKPLTGSIGTIAGALTTVKAVVRSMAGEVATLAGVLARVPAKALAGSLTPAGARSQQVTKGVTGVATPAGALLKVTTKAGLAGVVAPITGSLVTVKAFVREMAGTVATLTGALAQQTVKVLTGSAAPEGSLLRLITKPVGGTQASSGTVVTALTRVVSVAGVLASAGVLRREPAKALAGASTPAGALSRQLARSLSGVIASITGLLQVFVPSQISPRNRPVALFGADERVMRLAGCDERVFALAGADDRVAHLVGGGEHTSRLAGGLEQLARLFGIRQEDD